MSDDKGPIADAIVRLAPENGDAVVVATDRAGVARADHLEPGTWRISAAAAEHLPAALPTHTLAAGADDKLAIKLATGGRPLTGTVSDATGGPIAGARVDAARLSQLAEPGDAVATTLTGADGKYRVTVADGALLVAASSPDYAPQSRRVEVGPRGAVADFVLIPGGVIEGIVRDEHDRQPVAGASVLAHRGAAILFAETGAHRVVSGGDGRFRISGLRPGEWELGASDHMRRSKQPTRVGLGVAEQVGNVELLIGDGPVIRGNAVDDTGAPAPNIEILAIGGGHSGGDRTDAAGAFTLAGLRPGNYAITGSGDGYLGADTTRVALVDKDITGVVVTVKRGVTVTGHVEPRQRCEVQQGVDERSSLVILAPSTSTGTDGEFKLGPIAGGPARLTAHCASGDQGDTQITVAAGMPDVVFKLAPGASITGRVLDGDGQPVIGITVIANEESRGEHITVRNGTITSGVQGLTDATGGYQLVGLLAGSYRLGALDGGRPLRMRNKPPNVELANAEHKTGIDLAIDRPTGVISGTVTGPDGKPLADAWVSVQQSLISMLAGERGGNGSGGPQLGSRMMVVDDQDDGAAPGSVPPALTDAKGHYAIRGLPAATYAVTAEAQRGQLRARAVDVKPDATVDLALVAVTTLSGTVTGPAGPAALFSVHLDGPTPSQRTFTDGSFAFEHIDPGAYTLRVSSAEGNGEAKVDVTSGAPATVAIALAPNAIVTGKLVDSAGNRLAGKTLALLPDSDNGRLQLQFDGSPTTSDADGSFRIEHRAETCALLVLRAPRPFIKRGLVLTAGNTLDLGTVTVDSPTGPGSPPTR